MTDPCRIVSLIPQPRATLSDCPTVLPYCVAPAVPDQGAQACPAFMVILNGVITDQNLTPEPCPAFAVILNGVVTSGSQLCPAFVVILNGVVTDAGQPGGEPPTDPEEPVVDPVEPLPDPEPEQGVTIIHTTNDQVTVLQGESATVNVLANDTATRDGQEVPLSVIWVAEPAYGTARINPDGTITFTADHPTHTGIVDVLYQVEADDGTRASPQPRIRVTVEAAEVPDQPEDPAEPFPPTEPEEPPQPEDPPIIIEPGEPLPEDPDTGIASSGTALSSDDMGARAIVTEVKPTLWGGVQDVVLAIRIDNSGAIDIGPGTVLDLAAEEQSSREERLLASPIPGDPVPGVPAGQSITIWRGFRIDTAKLANADYRAILRTTWPEDFRTQEFYDGALNLGLLRGVYEWSRGAAFEVIDGAELDLTVSTPGIVSSSSAGVTVSWTVTNNSLAATPQLVTAIYRARSDGTSFRIASPGGQLTLAPGETRAFTALVPAANIGGGADFYAAIFPDRFPSGTVFLS